MKLSNKTVKEINDRVSELSERLEPAPSKKNTAFSKELLALRKRFLKITDTNGIQSISFNEFLFLTKRFEQMDRLISDSIRLSILSEK